MHKVNSSDTGNPVELVLSIILTIELVLMVTYLIFKLI